MNIVEIEQVTKSFASCVAVNDLSLNVPEGSIYGFIGPNGSGKTTTLRMIMRIYRPDQGKGHIRVLGEEQVGAATDRVGYLPEERGLYKKMKVRELLRFYAELKGVRNFRAAADAWLERMDFTAWADSKIEALSKGMAQKVQFIATVIADPELVILDEPFSGLDPVNTEVFRDAVIDLRNRGATVIFSTHDMAMAEKMCDFIFMIHKGEKVLDGTMASIHEAYAQDTIRVRMDGDGFDPASVKGVESVNDHGQLQDLRIGDGVDTQDVLTELMARGRVLHFELAKPSLHDIFVRIARPELDEQEADSRSGQEVSHA